MKAVLILVAALALAVGECGAPPYEEIHAEPDDVPVERTYNPLEDMPYRR